MLIPISNHLSRSIVCMLTALAFSVSAGTEDGRIQITGHLVQGGMATGRVPPGSQVTLGDRTVRVSEEGVFVVGFGRDAPPSVEIRVVFPNGSVGGHRVRVTQRGYDIQRIDGLPPKQVTPDPEVLERIQREAEMVRAARTIDDPRTDFTGDFIWPLKGRISGVFGSQRILNGEPRRPHYGLDIAAAEGTPIVAPASGIVTLVHDNMYYSGGTVILDHGHGVSSVFIHMREVLVVEGSRIEQGETIGTVGATGRATGPHLHWGLNWFTERLDPQLLLP